MKPIYNIILSSVVSLTITTSCNYLDIVPDENAKVEDTYSDPIAAEKFMYKCYSYIPQDNSGGASLILMTGDEVITSFEHETFAKFPRGEYTADNTVISPWTSLFNGIRKTYEFLNVVDKVPSLEENIKNDYKAQCKFLLAYYHYILIKCYGPTIIVTNEVPITTPAEEYAHREPLDRCVEWVANMFDEAANGLPTSREQVQFGLATSVAAKAFKAKLLLFAASPLFNEKAPEIYNDLTDPTTGEHLMPTSYDATKWTKAREALKEAIDLAESNGFALYSNTSRFIGTNGKNQYPAAGTVRCMRYGVIDYEEPNPEVIFAETRSSGYYNIIRKSLPFYSGQAWNGVCPTWAMLNRFYTKNGLPWDEDPQYKNINKLDTITIDNNHASEGHLGSKTIVFNLDREPRFYAWIAFQGGYYEIKNSPSGGAYVMSNGRKNTSDTRLICDFMLNGNCGNTSRNPRSNNYSPGGYLNKKYVNPDAYVGTSAANGNAMPERPFPIMRLADLYLMYAEACVETNDLETAKTYLNKVRIRAGIPTVETSWNGVAQLTQEKLRQIVRQERMNEFYLEGQNFFDMRRWLLAEQYFNVKGQGMNVKATTIEDFAQLTEIEFARSFTAPKNYLLPIPMQDINRNINLVNNPGYTGFKRN